MFRVIIGAISDSDVILFGSGILIVFLLLFAAFWMGWRISQWKSCPSPYSGLPLRKAATLSYDSMERVLRYLYNLKQFDNRIFEIGAASFCRETGRIFQNSITWYDTISVDWGFLNKRYPGRYVSWGSLTLEQQSDLRDRHEALNGFQTEKSSKNPSPRHVETEFVYLKPGPLYVDVNTGVLLGWKVIPGTELEVLIVQKPKPSLRKFTF